MQTQLNTAQTVLNKMENELSNNNKVLREYGSLSEKAADSAVKLDNEISGLNDAYAKTGDATENLKDKQEILSEILEKQDDKIGELVISKVEKVVTHERGARVLILSKKMEVKILNSIAWNGVNSNTIQGLFANCRQFQNQK